MKELRHLFDKLEDPEYLHLLLEPLMIYGLAIGLLVFVFSFFMRERKTQLAGLVLVIVSTAMVVPYMKAREKSDERVVKLMSVHKEAIIEQQKRRDEAEWAYFLVAGLAGVTLLMGAHKGKGGLVMGGATVVAGLALVLFGMAMHLRDSAIYHPNLRVTEDVADARKPKRDKDKAGVRESSAPPRDRRAVTSISQNE